MGMGGGGGGAVPPAGLTPLQQQQFDQGTALYDRYFREGKPIAKEMAGLAQGGLMVRGLRQVNEALAAPSVAPGMMARAAARMGVTATPEQQAAMDQQRALAQASTGVRLRNAARESLATSQQDMRFGGLA